MRVIALTLTGLTLLPLRLYAQAQPSPYADHQHREIKALSPEQTAAYLSGDGMGFAIAAELNHYPGPKHVLDMAVELELTEAQRTTAERIFRTMHDEAVRLGGELIARERTLDSLFAAGTITQAQLWKLVGEIAAFQGRLRSVHLGAHLEMKELLRPDQVIRYDQLRGYGETGHQHRH